MVSSGARNWRSYLGCRERHNHAVVLWFRAAETKRCEPMSPFARSGPVTLQISTLGAALVGDVLRSRVACRPVSARPNSVAERIDRGCTLGRALSLGGAEGVPAAFPDGDEVGVAASAAKRRQRRLRRHDLSQISSEQWSERFRIPLLEFGGSSVFVALPPDRSDSGRSRGAPSTETGQRALRVETGCRTC